MEMYRAITLVGSKGNRCKGDYLTNLTKKERQIR